MRYIIVYPDKTEHRAGDEHKRTYLLMGARAAEQTCTQQFRNKPAAAGTCYANWQHVSRVTSGQTKFGIVELV